MEEYRKKFIEDFSKRFEIDLENKLISNYLYEIMEEKDKEIERLNNIINEAIETLEVNIEECNYDSASVCALEILKENKND